MTVHIGMLRILGPLAESLLFVLLLTRRFTFLLILNRITEINSNHLPIRDFDTLRWLLALSDRKTLELA
jgi:hypothetical protein